MKAAGTGRPARIYGNRSELSVDLASRLGNGDVVLFKGSRMTAMEKVYEECLAMRGAGGE